MIGCKLNEVKDRKFKRRHLILELISGSEHNTDTFDYKKKKEKKRSNISYSNAWFGWNGKHNALEHSITRIVQLWDETMKLACSLKRTDSHADHIFVAMP